MDMKSTKPERTDGFLLKIYEVCVSGFPGVRYCTPTPGSAMSKAWYDYSVAFDVNFKDFLKIARIHRVKPPEDFGAEITINGKKAFYVSQDGQYVHFTRPGDSRVLLSHPNDVEPKRFRPIAYQVEEVHER